MLYSFYIISIIDVLILILPLLISVAFITVAERKIMASMQRRLGPNYVGFYGLLQAFADALKLLLKEYVLPTLADKKIFFLGPNAMLIFSLLGFAMLPLGPGLAISDFNLGLLFILTVSSLSTYGILLSGWSANSKYAFLGSLRSTAQLLSYELILTSAILLVILVTGSFNMSIISETQKGVWLMLPLFPIFILFYICCVAETNRAPFDLAEAESELVSGFMTEHAAVIFVFFFLGEYASILLICSLTTILFIGSYLIYVKFFTYINFIQYITNQLDFSLNHSIDYNDIINSIYDSYLSSFILSIKVIILVFGFILIRASYPRIRFDQLMSYCWVILLPLIVGFIILIPSILDCFEMISNDHIIC